MLYDNAQFISVFSISDFLNKDTKNLFLVQQTVYYWLGLSKKNHHLFPASVDADNKDVTGAQYIFKKSEVLKNLTKEQSYCKSYFNITQDMLWENNWHMHRTNYDNSKEAKKIISKLKKKRKNKSFPAIDNKGICTWNCMMIIDLLDASISYNKI